jgi:hypothetical protein
MKLFLLLDEVFPFFISDSMSKEPKFLSDFSSKEMLQRVLLLKMIPILPKPLTKIQVLTGIVLDEASPKLIRFQAFKQLNELLKNSGAFDGYDSEIPIFISEALRKNASGDLYELVTLVKNNMLRYEARDGHSPVISAVKEGRALFQANISKRQTEAPDWYRLPNGQGNL